MFNTKKFPTARNNNQVNVAQYSLNTLLSVNAILNDPSLSRIAKIELLTSIVKVNLDLKHHLDKCVNEFEDPYDTSNPAIVQLRASSERAVSTALRILDHMNRALGTNFKVIDVI